MPTPEAGERGAGHAGAGPAEAGSAGRPVALAAVAGAHGIRGEVRLKLFAESLASFAAHRTFDAGGRTLTLEAVREGPSGPIARFAEVVDRSAAEALRGAELTVPRAALPPLCEGEVYWVDLIGRAVVTPDGAPAGRVVAMANYGASDLLEVARPDGRTVLVPFTREAVPKLADPLVIDPVWLEV
nr:ribosome maturation factor RimM [Thermaurantiacus tibetensis]